jgi:hypothetical protein
MTKGCRRSRKRGKHRGLFVFSLNGGKRIAATLLAQAVRLHQSP